MRDKLVPRRTEGCRLTQFLQAVFEDRHALVDLYIADLERGQGTNHSALFRFIIAGPATQHDGTRHKIRPDEKKTKNR